MLKTLKRYHSYVNKTLKLQKIMGFDGNSGILIELDIIEQNIKKELYSIDNKSLNILFLEIQLLEKDFSNTLNMKLAKQLLSL